MLRYIITPDFSQPIEKWSDDEKKIQVLRMATACTNMMHEREAEDMYYHNTWEEVRREVNKRFSKHDYPVHPEIMENMSVMLGWL